jgi:hypothetical protein
MLDRVPNKADVTPRNCIKKGAADETANNAMDSMKVEGLMLAFTSRMWGFRRLLFNAIKSTSTAIVKIDILRGKMSAEALSANRP